MLEKVALLALEEEGRIEVDVPAEGRPVRKERRTLGDERIITIIGGKH